MVAKDGPLAVFVLFSLRCLLHEYRLGHLWRLCFFWHFLFIVITEEENESPQNKQCSVLSVRHWGEPSQSQQKQQLARGWRLRPPPSIDRQSPQPRSLHFSFQICRCWFLKFLASYKKLSTIHEICLFFDLAVLNQTFLRAVGGLTGTPCRWHVNRPSAELVLDSFHLCFGHG